MAVYFLDTSAVVKIYVEENGSDWLQGITTPSPDDHFVIARITEVEFTSAITRRRILASITGDEAAAALSEFRHGVSQFYRILEITTDLLHRAVSIAERHGLRAYDAVQLAGALTVSTLYPALVMISSDRVLNNVAALEGLSVDDPNQHPH